MVYNKKMSFFNCTFWDLWLQKLFRNIASVKYQWLLLLYVPTIWGMFHINIITNKPWISAIEGLTFLGGGFVTLAISRLVARTRLTEDEDDSSVLHDEDGEKILKD